ncbi:stalk domain-containing protein [Paenibacillus sp.]|uniref:stalk domain-containing protein n=1 Tax=Paenibacillus sp. TaxID=58172 RepID=UPI002810ED3A|nr:stalk domain-containing protein [Paenibacillus sp.]
MKHWLAKRILAASLSAALLLGGAAAWPDTSSADEAAPRTSTREVVFDIDRGSVSVNGRAPATTYPMTIHNGRVYVAARQLAEAFGFTAEYDPKSYDAVLRNDETRIHVNQGAMQAWVNDMPAPFDGLGLVKDGRLLLSIRAIADYMGLYVGYDPVARKATVADPEFPFAKPVNPAEPNFVPIDFARYGAYPLVAATATPDASSRTLLFSDSPETFREFGVLYRDEVDGDARLFLTHVNGMKAAATVGWLATNESDAPVTVAFTRQGVAARSKDYAKQGREALAAWLAGGAEDRRTVGPGETVVLYRTEPLSPMDGAHAVFDVTTDGALRFDVVAAPASEPLAVARSTPFAARDIHDRGTFPVSEIRLTADAAEWEPGEPARIRIGAVGSLSGHYAVGTDAVTGEPAQNFGNYGVIYRLKIESPGKAAFVLVPLRGLYMGAVKFDGDVVKTDALHVGEGYAIGRTSGAEASVELELGAASGSFMPFEVLVVPLP